MLYIGILLIGTWNVTYDEQSRTELTIRKDGTWEEVTTGRILKGVWWVEDKDTLCLKEGKKMPLADEDEKEFHPVFKYKVIKGDFKKSELTMTYYVDTPSKFQAVFTPK